MNGPLTTCCRHLAPPRAVFRFPGRPGSTDKCWRCAVCHLPMLWRSAGIALVVGTILGVINHGDEFVRGDWNAITIVKTLVTYGVPFSVAACSALWNGRIHPAPDAGKTADTV